MTPLVSALADSEWHIQFSATLALGELGLPGCESELARLMDSGDPDLKTAAEQSLARIGSPLASEALEPLRLAQLSAPDAETRAAAALALRSVNTVRSIDALTAALRDSAPRVRRFAAESLGTLKAASATNALLPLLGEPDGEVRAAATLALGMIGDPQSLPAVARLLDAPDLVVASAAARSLRGYAGSERAVAVLKETLTRLGHEPVAIDNQVWQDCVASLRVLCTADQFADVQRTLIEAAHERKRQADVERDRRETAARAAAAGAAERVHQRRVAWVRFFHPRVYRGFMEQRFFIEEPRAFVTGDAGWKKFADFKAGSSRDTLRRGTVRCSRCAKRFAAYKFTFDPTPMPGCSECTNCHAVLCASCVSWKPVGDGMAYQPSSGTTSELPFCPSCNRALTWFLWRQG